MTIISEHDFNKARKAIRETKGEVIFSSNDDELNKKVLEKEKIDILLINLRGRKDFQKQRNSGFDNVMARLSAKKNVALGLNLDELLSARGKEKAEILARVKQNVKICIKNKVKIKFIGSKKENERNAYDLKALGLVLGMPTWMTKNL